MTSENRIINLRIKNLINEVYGQRYSDKVPLHAQFVQDSKQIPYTEIKKLQFKPIEPGTRWGELWDSAWFIFSGEVPPSFKDREVVALIEIGGEGCVFEDGEPKFGLTYKRIDKTDTEVKRRIPLFAKAEGGESVEVLVEAAANGLFGEPNYPQNPDFPCWTLNQAEIAVFQRDYWQLALDLDFLLQLYSALDENSPRARKILRNLNKAANIYKDGQGISEAKAITDELINVPASSSDMTVWSVGHAHLDLGWLWPYRETKRKGGRTFATALQMIQEYPEYIFGASQAQLFYWMKDRYPKLYNRIKGEVASGRIEVQGAMWVEPDMNLAGGEALVRQCLYGKHFFKEEFGVDVTNLWLPDVFGYSAALPQILKRCGVDKFITQKISWNESNKFPHHTFQWEGIDGTRITSHFLPTNNYNLFNRPQELLDSQQRFAQSDIHEGFLNLYGIGDGGGGPSRKHIELGKRAQNCEGLPKFKFSKAQDFLDYLDSVDESEMPVWVGELYLELHRGTYTNQALMKLYNRKLELALRDAEILWSHIAEYPKESFDAIWRDTLLNQFHDVLPGSSIDLVYQDAHAMSTRNLDALSSLTQSGLELLLPKENTTAVTFYNSLSWERSEVVALPGCMTITDKSGAVIPQYCNGVHTYAQVTVPPLGYITYQKSEGITNSNPSVQVSDDSLENEMLSIKLDDNGIIISLFDKKLQREMLEDGANRFMLFEDKPYLYDAWEISGYYRETEAETGRLRSRKITVDAGLYAEIEQVIEIGNSLIKQRLSLSAQAHKVDVECTVDWKEEKKLLKVQAVPDVHSHEATYEIQFGSLKRPTHSNTSWEAAQFEVCAHRYADLSQPDFGFSICNTSKYGHYIKGNVMELSLLKSAVYPDPTSDRHSHNFTFSYVSHAGDVIEGGVHKIAHNLNSSLLHADNREGDQPVYSMFSVDGSVEIETVKRSEDGTGVVVRLYETCGKESVVTLGCAEEYAEIMECDLLERHEEPADIRHLKFTPFQIRSFFLKQ